MREITVPAAADAAVMPADPAYGRFKEEFLKLSGISLSLYKEKQMKRRINTLLERRKLSGYDALIALMRSSPGELMAFCDYITINVTEFFRTPEHWELFEAETLPDLSARGGKLKVWSCAAATGEEPYSLAMSLYEAVGPERFSITATDLDERVLAFAREGLYDGNAVSRLPERYLDRYFTQEGSKWRVRDELKQCVSFSKLDLLSDAYPEETDLIVCRNVLIYFTEEGKDRVYRGFKKSLKADGYLFTGNTEQIVYYKQYGLKRIRNFLYQNS